MSLSHKQMTDLAAKGIGPSKFKGAFRNADYLGNPGKDLFFWIENKNTTKEQMNEVARLLARAFPDKPPHNPIQYGACIRYVYGCFEKQGILRSKKDKQRMVNEKQTWERSVVFIDFLYDHFIKLDKNFGLALLCEQMAHRFGDRYVIDGDSKYLSTMEYYYRRAYDFALKCKSKKHLMTTFYWEGRYWAEIGNKKKAIHYYRQAVKAANSFCPDARQSLRDKIMDEFVYLSKHDPNYKEFLKRWKKGASNKAVKAVVAKLK